MNGRWTIALAALVAVAVAVPATVIARGDTIPDGPADRFVTESVSDVSTNSNQYEPVGLSPPTSGAAMGITVSAQMTAGKARFRLATGGFPAQPSSVLFSSKAANSFSFGIVNDCPAYQVEWKRVGNAPAKAALVSYLAVYWDEVCA